MSGATLTAAREPPVTATSLRAYLPHNSARLFARYDGHSGGDWTCADFWPLLSDCYRGTRGLLSTVALVNEQRRYLAACACDDELDCLRIIIDAAPGAGWSGLRDVWRRLYRYGAGVAMACRWSSTNMDRHFQGALWLCVEQELSHRAAYTLVDQTY